jgi:hypothetical protein
MSDNYLKDVMLNEGHRKYHPLAYRHSMRASDIGIPPHPLSRIAASAHRNPFDSINNMYIADYLAQRAYDPLAHQHLVYRMNEANAKAENMRNRHVPPAPKEEPTDLFDG